MNRVFKVFVWCVFLNLLAGLSFPCGGVPRLSATVDVVGIRDVADFFGDGSDCGSSDSRA